MYYISQDACSSWSMRNPYYKSLYNKGSLHITSDSLASKHYNSLLLSHGFASRDFSYLWTIVIQKYHMESSRNKHGLSFKMHGA